MIELRDSKVIDFFARNPQLDPTEFLHTMIDTYEYMQKSMTGNNTDQLLKHILALSSSLDKSNLENSTKLELLRGDIQCKFADYKATYTSSLEELRASITKCQLENSSKILNDLLSYTRETLSNSNSRHQQDLCNEIKYMLSSTLKESNTTQHILNIVTSSEARMTQILNDLRGDATNTQNLNVQLNSLLDKFNNNSSTKGRLSENILSNVLSKLYPTAEVTDTRDTAHSCDIRLRRMNGKPDILFENKNYTRNVNTEEVKKFQEDIKTHNVCGIMLSQQSGIVHKPDYHIEITSNRKVSIYLHNVDYDCEKLKLAVQIIDHMQDSLDRLYEKEEVDEESEEGESLRLSKEEINQINVEYQTFIKNRENLISFLKDSNNEAILKVKNMEFPQINILMRVETQEDEKKGVIKSVYKCKKCNKFEGKSRGELYEHKRSCK